MIANNIEWYSYRERTFLCVFIRSVVFHLVYKCISRYPLELCPDIVSPCRARLV